MEKYLEKTRLELFNNFSLLNNSNIDDAISASMVLQDGYGQCNTKGRAFCSYHLLVELPIVCNTVILYSILIHVIY